VLKKNREARLVKQTLFSVVKEMNKPLLAASVKRKLRCCKREAAESQILINSVFAKTRSFRRNPICGSFRASQTR
jgi:hypothetical protein